MRDVAPELSWIEQETSKLKVVGSNPTGATSYDFERLAPGGAGFLY